MNILVVFPHPDDGALHAGGAMAKWVDQGHSVTAVCCTRGNLGTLRHDETGDEVAERREQELRDANDILGIQNTVLLGYPDGGFMAAGELRRDLVRCVRTYRAERVLTLDPWVRYEVHPDHLLAGRMAAEAAAFAPFPLLYPEQTAGRTCQCPLPVPSEVWFMGALGHEPNCFVDVSSTVDRKIAAVLAFASTVAVLARQLDEDVDPVSISDADMRLLSQRAADMVRSMAQRAGRPVNVSAAEPFFVQRCLPGHFDNMDTTLEEMLGGSASAPRLA